MSLERRPLCTEDLTFERDPAWKLFAQKVSNLFVLMECRR